MRIDVYSLSLIFSIIFIYIIIELVRRNRLSEKYSLLWLLFSLVMIFFASSPRIIENIASFLDVKYAPSLLFLIGLIFLLLYNLSMTLVISKQGDRVIKMAQEISILKEQIQKESKGEK
jgi:hypothetical protein